MNIRWKPDKTARIPTRWRQVGSGPDPGAYLNRGNFALFVGKIQFCPYSSIGEIIRKVEHHGII
jgi:hypothetical protein